MHKIHIKMYMLNEHLLLFCEISQVRSSRFNRNFFRMKFQISRMVQFDQDNSLLGLEMFSVGAVLHTSLH